MGISASTLPTFNLPEPNVLVDNDGNRYTIEGVTIESLEEQIRQNVSRFDTQTFIQSHTPKTDKSVNLGVVPKIFQKGDKINNDMLNIKIKIDEYVKSQISNFTITDPVDVSKMEELNNMIYASCQYNRIIDIWVMSYQNMKSVILDKENMISFDARIRTIMLCLYNTLNIAQKCFEFDGKFLPHDFNTKLSHYILWFLRKFLQVVG